jgi:hypothetical protein
MQTRSGVSHLRQSGGDQECGHTDGAGRPAKDCLRAQCRTDIGRLGRVDEARQTLGAGTSASSGATVAPPFRYLNAEPAILHVHGRLTIYSPTTVTTIVRRRGLMSHSR